MFKPLYKVHTSIAPGEEGCMDMRVSKRATISDRSQDGRKCKMPLIYFLKRLKIILNLAD